MKKLFCIFLCLTLLVTIFSGCNVILDNDRNDTSDNRESEANNHTDIWDGSIAGGFSAGEGTENDPYQIRTAAELAYVARAVNKGEDVADNHFTLCTDIDLNNIDWTPIGTYECKFNGYFNGNGHLIKNLKISSLVHFTTTVDDAINKSGVAGLFGVCENVQIYNINLDNVSVFIPSEELRNIYLGGLIGYVHATTECSVCISNVNILNASFNAADNPKKGMLRSVGGLIGYAFLSDNTTCDINNISICVDSDICNGYGSLNYAGGLIGYISGDNIKCSNFSSDLSYVLPDSMVHSYVGAFGGISHSGSGSASISNAFSKVGVQKNTNNIPFYENEIHAIIGKTYQSKNLDGTVDGGYIFENLYGYVNPIGNNTGYTEKQLTLYSMPSHAKYTETSCVGCTSLPENHGLDENVWDITILSEPKLK